MRLEPPLSPRCRAATPRTPSGPSSRFSKAWRALMASPCNLPAMPPTRPFEDAHPRPSRGQESGRRERLRKRLSGCEKVERCFGSEPRMFVQSVAQGQLPFGKGWKEGFRSGSKVSNGGRKAGRRKWKGQETPDAGEGSHARRKGEGGRGVRPRASKSPHCRYQSSSKTLPGAG